MEQDCPFKSPEELGLTLVERDALIKTLLLMENGQIEHVKNPLTHPTIKPGRYGFYMPDWRDKWPCGTVCCIGGTAELVGGLEYNSLAEAAHRNSGNGNDELANLFYRWGGGSPSPQRAGHVLRGYLTTGKTQW